MDKNLAKKKFQKLFTGVNGYEISYIARSKLDYFYNADIYGEVMFESFYEMLEAAQPRKNEVFYDLGSGTGKAVITASLCYPFSKSIGVEKMDEMYQTSSQIAKKLNNSSVKFIQADFNDYDFTDGNVIFINSYYFYYDMQSPEFMEKIKNLKEGTRIIFVEMPIIAPFLQLIHERDYNFSWGDARVYVMTKI